MCWMWRKNFLQVPVQRVRGRDAQAWSHGQDGSCLHSCERNNCVHSIYKWQKKCLWVAFDWCSRKFPQDYIRDTYCPTLGDHQHFCRESLSRYYVGMLVIYWSVCSVCSFLFHVKSCQIIIVRAFAVRHCGTLFRGWSSSRLSNWRSLWGCQGVSWHLKTK